jgi:hypothetical protein
MTVAATCKAPPFAANAKDWTPENLNPDFSTA